MASLWFRYHLKHVETITGASSLPKHSQMGSQGPQCDSDKAKYCGLKGAIAVLLVMCVGNHFGDREPLAVQQRLGRI